MAETLFRGEQCLLQVTITPYDDGTAGTLTSGCKVFAYIFKEGVLGDRIEMTEQSAGVFQLQYDTKTYTGDYFVRFGISENGTDEVFTEQKVKLTTYHLWQGTTMQLS